MPATFTWAEVLKISYRTDEVLWSHIVAAYRANRKDPRAAMAWDDLDYNC